MSSKKISSKPQKNYTCSEYHKKRVAETADLLGVSDSDIIVLAVEDFLKKSFADQLAMFAIEWQRRAENARDECNAEK